MGDFQVPPLLWVGCCVGLRELACAWFGLREPSGASRLVWTDLRTGLMELSFFFLRAEALPSCRSAEMVVADEECSYRRTKRNDCEET